MEITELDFNDSCYELTKSYSTQPSQWNGREVSNWKNTDRRFIDLRPMMSKAEGNLKGGYNEREGGYIEAEFKIHFEPPAARERDSEKSRESQSERDKSESSKTDSPSDKK